MCGAYITSRKTTSFVPGKQEERKDETLDRLPLPSIFILLETEATTNPPATTTTIGENLLGDTIIQPRRIILVLGNRYMALRRFLGFSDGELMRSDAKPCSRLMRQTAGIFSVGGALGFWILCRLHYGPRITIPRSLRWAGCGAVSVSSTTALLVRLFSPECEPQNIAAYDHKK